ncbi:hypothetical protein Rhopal_001445-T1 [Rhodotorula paludigena]|uniref:Uncharacterized protein n=1 Tax=Rhodotorula paludigena TaxID=86838 RepID=A0AAV5GDC7_9BASI|nr:hypothetical protein Rhopal_001445-T1 [Rhodotorula paludigena]
MGRAPFTQQDKDNLARFLAGYPSGSRARPSTHKELALRHPNHTDQSWMNHYKKNKDSIEARIKRIKRERKRSQGASPSQPRAHTRQDKGKGKATPIELSDDEADEEDQLADEDDEDAGPQPSTSTAHLSAPSASLSTMKKKRPLADLPLPTLDDDDDEKGRDSFDAASDSDEAPHSRQKKKNKRAGRTKYTADDFAALVKMCYRGEKNGWSKAQIYTELEEENPDHSATSWQTYHSNNRDDVQDALDQYRRDQKKRQKKRAARASEEHLPTPPQKKTSKVPRASLSAATVDSRSRSASEHAPPVASSYKAKQPRASISTALMHDEGRDAGAAAASTPASAAKGKPSTAMPPPAPSQKKAAPLPASGQAAATASSPPVSGPEVAAAHTASENGPGVLSAETFTPEDDEALVVALARAQLKRIQQDTAFLYLSQSAKTAHHPEAAWRARYYGDLGGFIVRIGQRVQSVEAQRRRKREEEAAAQRDKEEKEAAEREERERRTEEAEAVLRERERVQREESAAERQAQEARAGADEHEDDEETRMERERIQGQKDEQNRLKQVRKARAEAQRKKREEQVSSSSPPPVPSQEAAPQRAPPVTTVSQPAPVPPSTTAHPKPAPKPTAVNSVPSAVLTPRSTPPFAVGRPAAATAQVSPTARAATQSQRGVADAADAAGEDSVLQAAAHAADDEDEHFSGPTSSQPRHSQYSQLPSPFLAAGVHDDDDVDELASDADEDDRQLDRQLAAAVAFEDARVKDEEVDVELGDDKQDQDEDVQPDFETSNDGFRSYGDIYDAYILRSNAFVSMLCGRPPSAHESSSASASLQANASMPAELADAHEPSSPSPQVGRAAGFKRPREDSLAAAEASQTMQQPAKKRQKLDDPNRGAASATAGSAAPVANALQQLPTPRRVPRASLLAMQNDSSSPAPSLRTAAIPVGPAASSGPSPLVHRPPAQPPTNAVAPRSTSAAPSGRPSLKVELEQIAASHGVPFDLVRNVYYCCNACIPMPTLQQLVGFYAAAAAPQHAELVERTVWTMHEDQIVLEGTSEARARIDERKGAGAVDARRAFLARAGVRKVADLRASKYPA